MDLRAAGRQQVVSQVIERDRQCGVVECLRCCWVIGHIGVGVLESHRAVTQAERLCGSAYYAA